MIAESVTITRQKTTRPPIRTVGENPIKSKASAASVHKTYDGTGDKSRGVTRTADHAVPENGGIRKSVRPRPESEIQRAVLQALNATPGVFAFRVNSRVLRMPGRGGRDRLVRFGGFKGVSDLVGWVRETHYDLPAPPRIGKTFRARFLAVEVKRPGGKLTPEQAAFLRAVQDAGGIAFMATGVEDVQRHLRPA